MKQTSDKEIAESFENEYCGGSVTFSSIGHDDSRKATLTPGPMYYPSEVLFRKTPGAGSERPAILHATAFEHSFDLDRRNSSSEKLSSEGRSSVSPRGNDCFFFKEIVESITNTYSPRLPRATSDIAPNHMTSESLFNFDELSDEPPLVSEGFVAPPLGEFSGRYEPQSVIWSQSTHYPPRKNDHFSDTLLEHKPYDPLRTPTKTPMSQLSPGPLPAPPAPALHVLATDMHDSLHSLALHSDDTDFFSPGKNIHSEPFVPQNLRHGMAGGRYHSDYPSHRGPEMGRPPPVYTARPLLASSLAPVGTSYDTTKRMPPMHPSAEPCLLHGYPPRHASAHPPSSLSHAGPSGGFSNDSHAYHQDKHGYPPLPPGAHHPLDSAAFSGMDPKSLGPMRFPRPPQSHSISSMSSVSSDASSCNGLISSSGGESKEPMPSKRPTSPKPKTADQPLAESPVSKSIYKNFSKVFKLKEGESVSDAVAFAQLELPRIPDKVKWRVYIDLADTLKRNSLYDDARFFYKKVCKEYPLVNQGWLEWSKMEEECGHMDKCLAILRRGARTSNYNEVLLTKAIKQHERMNNLSGAREMLGRLQAEAIDMIWRTVLEGALLESRAGNIAVARRLLLALMQRVPWYGPIYHEAFRLEEKAELFDRAIAVVRTGLKELPRYGPLWFGMLRVMERFDILEEASSWTKGDVEPRLRRTREESQNAICCISRELVWKVHFEQAQTEERAAEIVAMARHLSSGKTLPQCKDELFTHARECFAKSLLSCPGNLRWKVFLAGARMELSAGKVSVAKALLRQARQEVPEKSKYHVYLECSKLEEYLGNINAARKILLLARREIKNEWKLYLEAVLVEARAGNVVGAVYLADKALKMDSGSGRLWALLVQLVHRVEWQAHGAKVLRSNYIIPKDLNTVELAEIIPPPDYKVPTKRAVLSRALQVVPKSGEVWCEGARTLLNPLSAKNFDPAQAQKYLSFAIQFTPQYGDSFIEYIRVEMLLQVVLPRVLDLLGISWSCFISCLEGLDKESDSHSVFCENGEGLEEEDVVAAGAYYGTMHETNSSRCCSANDIQNNMKLFALSVLDIGHCTEAYKHVSLDRLHKRCTNADPNYGTSWFFCRSRPFDTPSAVIRAAHAIAVHEMVMTQTAYVDATVKYVHRVITSSSANTLFSPAATDGDGESPLPEVTREWWIENFESILSQHEPRRPLDSVKPFVCVDSFDSCGIESGTILSSQDFVTSLLKLNRLVYTRHNSAEERRRMLFGVDQITP